MMPESLTQTLADIPQAKQIILIFPFTLSILSSPSPLLPTIFQILLAVPTQCFTVLFSSPRDASADVQLYDLLRRDVRSNWKQLQEFLAQVYATMAAAQWESGKIGLEVEVLFDGMIGVERRMKESDAVLMLDDYETLVPSSISSSTPTHSLPTPCLPSSSSSFLPSLYSPGPEVIALGGTFDHLHAAHKLLLHLAYFLAGRKVIVGVMADRLLSSKSNAELVQPIDERIEGVRGFMAGLAMMRKRDRSSSSTSASNDIVNGDSIDGQIEDEIELQIVEIQDAYGPTRSDPDIQALVISDETRSGGNAVNALRRENGLNELEIWSIDVISAGNIKGLVSDQPAPETSGSQQGEECWRRGDGGQSPVASSNGSGILRGMDEKTLKEVKMGSTGIRRWLAEKRDRERDRG